MAEFAFNQVKNASTGYTLFELNYSYHFWMSYKDDIDPRFWSKIVDKLLAELKKLIIVCCENFYYAQELQKQAHDKGIKSWSHVPGNKIWLNSKYIKTKQNQKPKAKFFGPFHVLYPVGKQAYKLKLPRK